MLPILLYEVLPLVYLFGGTILLVFGQSTLVLVSATLFYCAGAFIWIMRSENRRTDSRVGPSHKFIFLPEILYEVKPFFYLFIGLLLLRNAEFLIAGSLIIFWALVCEIRRSRHRQHQNRHEHKNPKLKTRMF